jgi:hypothetical protein
LTIETSPSASFDESFSFKKSSYEKTKCIFGEQELTISEYTNILDYSATYNSEENSITATLFFPFDRTKKDFMSMNSMNYVKDTIEILYSACLGNLEKIRTQNDKQRDKQRKNLESWDGKP